MTAGPAPPALAPPRLPLRRHGLGRLRLAHWYAFGGLLLAMLVVAAVAQSGHALYENGRAQDVLVDQVDPATLQQFQLTTALGRQDTAIRDLAATGDPRFLTVYRSAISDQARAVSTMRRLLAGVPSAGPVIDQLDQVNATTEAWRSSFADAQVADRALSPAEDRMGQQLFTQVRLANTGVQRGLTGLHVTADRRLRDRASDLYWSLGLTAAVIMLVAVTLALAIRRTVVRPVAELSEQAREVSAGDFAHPLQITGPAELAELAAYVDSMRHRIVEEWRRTAEARQRLDEQTIELRRSNSELEQFAYAASHDLQEPLRKVAGFCKLIERRYGDKLDDRGREYIDFAVDGAKRMQTLINDLLGFSRVGQITRTEAAIQLRDVLESAVDNLTAAIDESGAKITADELPELPGDRSLLTQLFQNLLGNAIKFHGAEPPRVHVGVHREGAMWAFSCADNGIGIEAQHADEIFLIFQRLHPQDEYTGTGIGLAMCKKIVEHHGGHMWLDTSAAHGATFRWTLRAELGVCSACEVAHRGPCRETDKRSTPLAP